MGVLGKDDTVVSMLSGNGLTVVENAIKAAGSPIACPNDMESLLRAFAENGVKAD